MFADGQRHEGSPEDGSDGPVHCSPLHTALGPFVPTQDSYIAEINASIRMASLTMRSLTPVSLAKLRCDPMFARSLNELGFGPFVGMHLGQVVQNVEALQSSLRGLWNMEHMARAEPSTTVSNSFGKGIQAVPSSSFDTGFGPPPSQIPVSSSAPSTVVLPGPTDIPAQSRTPLTNPSFTPAAVLDPFTSTPRPPVSTLPASSKRAAAQPTVPTLPVLQLPPSLSLIPEQVDDGRDWAISKLASSFPSGRRNIRRNGPLERRKTALNPFLCPVSSGFTFAKENVPFSELFGSQVSKEMPQQDLPFSVAGFKASLGL